MRLPKISIKNIIFILAVVVLLAAGLVWKLDSQPNSPISKSEPTNLAVYIDRGLTVEIKADLEKKVSDLEVLMASDEKIKADISQWLILGNRYYQLGNLSGAQKAYEHIFVTNPQDAPAHENLGQVLYEMGDFTGAESHWRTALETNPYEVTYIKLVNLIDEKFPAKHFEIQTILEEAIVNLGQTPGLLIRLGDWYLSEGNYQRAISHYQVAKQLDPTSSNIDQKIKEARDLWAEEMGN